MIKKINNLMIIRRLGWVSSIERNPTIEGQRVGLRLTPNPTY